MLICRGRINKSTVSAESKNLILLPSKNHVVNLIIKHYHNLVKHNGVNDTSNALRERFWVIRGRQTIKQVIRSCVVCLRSESLPYSCTSTPDLPSDRVSMIHLSRIQVLTLLVLCMFTTREMMMVSVKPTCVYSPVPQLEQNILS